MLHTVIESNACIQCREPSSAQALFIRAARRPPGRPAAEGGGCGAVDPGRRRRRDQGAPASCLERARGNGGDRRAAACHRDAWRACLPRIFSFRYVNPDAPKGGRLVRGILGTFDSLNPLIVKGLAPPELRGAVFESLMARGYDDRSRSTAARPHRGYRCRSTYVTFDIDPAPPSRPQAGDRADVIFSWNCCAITDARTTAPTTSRSQPRPRSASAPCGSTSPPR